MKNKSNQLFIAFTLISLIACSQDTPTIKNVKESKNISRFESFKAEPHSYGGWYCPDNLNGFPAVNIADWQNVKVVNNRMPTKEEIKNGSSLIDVDMKKYPYAKAIDIQLPKLAKIYNNSANREDLIIVIQAFYIDNDSIVGYRFLNGGNGSARFSEINFLTDKEISNLENSKFVSIETEINANPYQIWEEMRNEENIKLLAPIFDANHLLKTGWRKSTTVNYSYLQSGTPTATFANRLFGNFYIQNDFDQFQYTEKFLLLENDATKQTVLKIVCGPYNNDYETQKNILTLWAQKVKELSEKK